MDHWPHPKTHEECEALDAKRAKKKKAKEEKPKKKRGRKRKVPLGENDE